MNKYCVIKTACDDKDVTEKIINTLLEMKLVACAQISNICSSYCWNGKIENAKEYLIEMKTKKELFENVKEVILSMHNYEICEIIEYEITGGSQDYLKWIDDVTINI